MIQMNYSLLETAVSHQTIQQMQTDVKTTLEAVMGDNSPEMLNEMSTIFLEDAVPLIEKLKHSCSKNDFAAISMAAHTLKGSSATIGLKQFANLCLALESSSQQQEPALFNDLLAKLEVEYIRVEEALTAFLC
jgi:HPt (histidine-containing phosphotransfer) domain-containing protein